MINFYQKNAKKNKTYIKSLTDIDIKNKYLKNVIDIYYYIYINN
jgi:hypothetical protein